MFIQSRMVGSETYNKRVLQACRPEIALKLNRAFKVIQGDPY